MSCLFQLFKKKPVPPPVQSNPVINHTYSIRLFGPLPSTVEELRILELEIGARQLYLNGKSIKLYKNASHCQNKGDIKKAVLYIRHRKEILNDISRLNARLNDVQNALTQKLEVRSPLAVVQIK